MGVEMRASKRGDFLTFTLSDGNLVLSPSGLPTLHKKQVQLFIMKLRTYNERDIAASGEKDWLPIRYYACGEYGEKTGRPHYHGIFYNIRPNVLARVSEIWGLGGVSRGDVEPASIQYTSKYILEKQETFGDRVCPFALISNGIGKDYLRTNGLQHKATMQNYVVSDAGTKQAIPDYLRSKIFSIAEKESLRAESLKRNDLLYRQDCEQIKKFGYTDAEWNYEERQRHKEKRIRESAKKPFITKADIL